MEITTAQQIKDILAPIPPEKFITGSYGDKNGNCCSLGHIHVAIGGNAHSDFDGFGARELTKKYIREKHAEYADIASVNNKNNINGYNEPEIKDRVMHLIEDMIKDGH